MSNNDGGPAFPTDGWTLDKIGEFPPEKTAYRGMSLRDYFAAKALQGLCNRIGKHDADVMAHDAYIAADAMLAERQCAQK